MLKNSLAAMCFWLIAPGSPAQVVIARPVQSSIGADQRLTLPLLASLDSLFAGSDNYLSPEDSALDKSIFQDLRPADSLSLQLLNFYPLDKDRYWVAIGFMHGPELSKLLSVVARQDGDHFVFSLPLKYLTKDWQVTKVGNVTYHYLAGLDNKTAQEFDRKNTTIAKKLGLSPDKLDFYLTDNYQQILVLLGYTYDAGRAGLVRNGYMTTANTVFAVMHSADFSHDLVHAYVARVRTNTRNPAAEEGLAYYWGNAYYTDATGNSIDYPELLAALKTYLTTHPDSTLLSLFQNNPRIFNAYAHEVSVRSVISARICQEIETRKGVKGIMTLMNCGKGDNSYFTAVDALIGINRGNFNAGVLALLGGPPLPAH